MDYVTAMVGPPGRNSVAMPSGATDDARHGDNSEFEDELAALDQREGEPAQAPEGDVSRPETERAREMPPSGEGEELSPPLPVEETVAEQWPAPLPQELTEAELHMPVAPQSQAVTASAREIGPNRPPGMFDARVKGTTHATGAENVPAQTQSEPLVAAKQTALPQQREAISNPPASDIPPARGASAEAHMSQARQQSAGNEPQQRSAPDHLAPLPKDGARAQLGDDTGALRAMERSEPRTTSSMPLPVQPAQESRAQGAAQAGFVAQEALERAPLRAELASKSDKPAKLEKSASAELARSGERLENSSGEGVSQRISTPVTSLMPLQQANVAAVQQGMGGMLGAELALGDGGAGEPFGLQLSGADSLTRGAGTERSFLAVAAEPRMVSRQIAEAVVNMREGSVELRLSPEELGRVSLSMSQGEGGMLVHLAAERPETLELLRRHIALLETELGAMGFEAAAFSFGAAGQDGGSQGVEGQLAENADPAGAPLEQLGETIARDTSSRLSGALDARLDIRV